MEPAIFGIENDGLDLAVNLLILVLVVMWITLVYWTLQDARRRLSDPVLIGCSVAASFLFPFVGTVAYSIVRPPEYLEDVREREIETQAAEMRLAELQATGCERCGHRPVHQSFLLCPSCGHRLKVPCPSCSRPVAIGWRVCPFCEVALRRRKASGDRVQRVEGDSESTQGPKQRKEPARSGGERSQGEQRKGGQQRKGGGREGQQKSEPSQKGKSQAGKEKPDKSLSAAEREERRRRRQAARK